MRHSSIGIASFVSAIVGAVAAIVYVSAVMAGPPVNPSVADASIQTTMAASALGIVAGIASLFVRSRRRTLGIVGLIVAGTIGIGLVALIIIAASALRD